MKTIHALALGAALLAPVSAHAGATDGKWQIKVLGSAVLPDGKITKVEKGPDRPPRRIAGQGEQQCRAHARGGILLYAQRLGRNDLLHQRSSRHRRGRARRCGPCRSRHSGAGHAHLEVSPCRWRAGSSPTSAQVRRSTSGSANAPVPERRVWEQRACACQTKWARRFKRVSISRWAPRAMASRSMPRSTGSRPPPTSPPPQGWKPSPLATRLTRGSSAQALPTASDWHLPCGTHGAGWRPCRHPAPCSPAATLSARASQRLQSPPRAPRPCPNFTSSQILNAWSPSRAAGSTFGSTVISLVAAAAGLLPWRPRQRPRRSAPPHRAGGRTRGHPLRPTR